MEQIGYIFFGWLLGILASLTIRWSDRNQKINDFINGLYAQLLEIHPRLVGTYISIKYLIGPLSRDTVIWVNSMLPSSHNFTIDEILKTVNKMMLQNPEEVYEAASKQYYQLEKAVPKGKGLKKFNLNFLETNLSSISLLSNDLQVPLWKILDRINLINQEIDSYFFYLQKTFEPEVMKTNETQLKANMNSSLEMILKNIHSITNVILELLNNLKIHKDPWTYKGIFSKYKCICG